MGSGETCEVPPSSPEDLPGGKGAEGGMGATDVFELSAPPPFPSMPALSAAPFWGSELCVYHHNPTTPMRAKASAPITAARTSSLLPEGFTLAADAGGWDASRGPAATTDPAGGAGDAGDAWRSASAGPVSGGGFGPVAWAEGSEACAEEEGGAGRVCEKGTGPVARTVCSSPGAAARVGGMGAAHEGRSWRAA
jgi:hypothetical protein